MDIVPVHDEQTGPIMDDYIRDIDYPAETYY
jgi:hypothetical protein